jgi:hypothetical protein
MQHSSILCEARGDDTPSTLCSRCCGCFNKTQLAIKSAQHGLRWRTVDTPRQATGLEQVVYKGVLRRYIPCLILLNESSCIFFFFIVQTTR